jgi:hypothetical protein
MNESGFAVNCAQQISEASMDDDMGRIVNRINRNRVTPRVTSENRSRSRARYSGCKPKARR